MHVITGLHTGGAEMSLYRLVANSDADDVRHEVISLTGWGPIGDSLAARGVAVTALDLRGRQFGSGFARLVMAVRNARANVVQGWMYHANVLSALAARVGGGPPVVWNIRASTLEAGAEKASTRAVARCAGPLARLMCRAVVANSESAVATHVAFGYPRTLFRVIPNGFELELFRPDQNTRREVRRELAVPDDAPLIGIVGRYHPGKDHATFLRGAARLAATNRDVRFVLMGDRVDADNLALTSLTRAAGLGERVSLLGRRSDVHRVLTALDLLTSCSLYESFPNVVCEAMACGVPCVVSDVGDSSAIVADTGRVIPVRDVDALVTAWQELLALEPGLRRALGARARRRVEEHYSIDRVVRDYARLYRTMTHN